VKTTTWQIFGLFVDHSGTALVHCPSCGHQLRDDLGLALLGEQRWPVQGSQLTCSNCKSTGAVSYSGWVETPTLPALWQEIIAGLELPSTRMLLTQQAELLAVDSGTGAVVVGVKGEWLPMAESRLPLLEKAVAAVLPGHKPVLRPTALQSAAAPQLQEAIPAAETEKVGPEYPWEPGLRLVQEPIAPVVITEAPAPAAPELMFQDKPSPVAAVAVEPEVPVFDRSEAPTSRCVDGEVQLTLASWKRLRPDLDAELGRTQAVHQTYVRLYGEQPTKAQGSSCYGAERLTECLRALSGVVVRLDEPQWRIREDSQTNAAA
jgi:hypothetical protein